MPQLLLSADPGFMHLALEEFRRDSRNGRTLDELTPSVYLLDCDEGFWGLAEIWIDDPPVFARHICPVDLTVPLIATPRDLSRLSEAAVAEYADLLDPEVSFSVQSRILLDLPYKPFDVNRAVSAALARATNSPLDVKQPFQILSVVCAAANRGLESEKPAAPSDGQLAFLGLSLASHNISDWAGGVRRFRREKEQVSRAEFKMLEALEAFRIDLPAGGVALDLGAAPGGWTPSGQGQGGQGEREAEQVEAPDPRDLAPRAALGSRGGGRRTHGQLLGKPDDCLNRRPSLAPFAYASVCRP